MIKRIIANRPYESLNDFLIKNKLNKLQILNLIKAGAFDSVEAIPREQIMHNYLISITDQKQRLTLQNMQMLITKKLIPEEMKFYEKLFSFNKFLKTCKNGIYYDLNDAAINFITKFFDADIIINGSCIEQKKWDNIYKKAMEPMREYLKEHKEEMLEILNNSLIKENENKYASGNISSWEMDSISFYYHDHELKKSAKDYDDFFQLSEEPEIERSFITEAGQEIKIYKLSHIIGTVIDKDKNRNTVTLLTPTGVVIVKIYKNQFALYDKQISAIDENGKKKVIEKSWFQRGTKLMVQGIRRGQDYIPKKKAKSIYPVISKIVEIKPNGNLVFQYERTEVE